MTYLNVFRARLAHFLPLPPTITMPPAPSSWSTKTRAPPLVQVFEGITFNKSGMRIFAVLSTYTSPLRNDRSVTVETTIELGKKQEWIAKDYEELVANLSSSVDSLNSSTNLTALDSKVTINTISTVRNGKGDIVTGSLILNLFASRQLATTLKFLNNPAVLQDRLSKVSEVWKEHKDELIALGKPPVVADTSVAADPLALSPTAAINLGFD